MEKVLLGFIFTLNSFGIFAQLNSSNLNPPASAQPVPNATVTEKSATPQPQNIAPAPSPIPPIYPGAEVRATEVQKQIILPPSTPSGTQPVQKEPLSPIESTNNLQPNRPQREESSRKNTAVGLPVNTTNLNNTISPNSSQKVNKNSNSVYRVNGNKDLTQSKNKVVVPQPSSTRNSQYKVTKTPAKSVNKKKTIQNNINSKN